MKSKKTLVLIATLALVAVGVTLFVLSRGIKGYAHSVTALDGGQGLVTLWSNDGDGARQWLALNDADGTERWRVETTPLAAPIVGNAVATADAERVYLIESKGLGELVLDVVARKRSDGTVVWRTAATQGTTDVAAAASWTPLRLADGRLHFGYHAEPKGSETGSYTALIALDAGTGAILWRVNDKDDGARKIGGSDLVGGFLVFAGYRANWRSAATGAIVDQSPTDRLGCTTTDALILQDLEAETLLLQTAPTAAPVEFAKVPFIDGGTPNTSLALSSCGQRADDLVLTFEMTSNGRNDLLIVSFDTARREKWRLVLPNHRLNADWSRTGSAEIPMHGTLARFELVVRLNADRTPAAMVLIDLDKGAVAGEVLTPTMTSVFRVGKHHVMRISSPTEADVIAVIDGQTGAMLGARRYDLGPSEFDYSQVHGDVLWLNGFRVYVGLEDTAWLTLRLKDGLPVIYQNGDTEAPLVPMAIVR